MNLRPFIAGLGLLFFTKFAQAQLRPVSSPVFTKKVQTRGATDTIETAIDKGYPMYIMPLDYIVSDYDSTRGYFFGNGEFYFKTRKKWIMYGSECAELYYGLKNVLIKEVLIFGAAGVKGKADNIAVKVYTLDKKDSLPQTLIGKGYIDLKTVEKNGAKNKFTAVPITLGQAYVGDEPIAVSVDFSMVTDDTVVIVNTYKQDTTKRISEDRIVYRIGQFLAGRWFNLMKVYFSEDGYIAMDLGMALVVERNPVLRANSPLSSQAVSAHYFSDSKKLQFYNLPELKMYKIEILNALGQQLLSTPAQNSAIQLPDLKPGIYCAHIYSDVEHFTLNFLIP